MYLSYIDIIPRDDIKMGRRPRPASTARRPRANASDAAQAPLESMGLKSSIRNQNVSDIFRHRRITRDSSQGTVLRYLQQTLLC